MNIVRPNLYESFTYLKPKSEEEIYQLVDEVFSIEFDIFLNENLNEQFDIAKVKEFISKLKDKKKAFYQLITKFNETHNLNAKKYIAAILVMMYLSSFTAKNSQWSYSVKDVETISNMLAKNEKIDVKQISISIEKPVIKKELVKSKYVKIATAKTSDIAKIMIKKHEQLKLRAYSIGDGKITIGYGHAEPERKSVYKVGDVISEKKADLLFEKDLKKAEDGVKRMLLEWEKKGIVFIVTQHMFDSMTSMAFNMGITGFRKSEFVKLLKSKSKKAAEKIKTTGLDPNFPGLEKRRAEEYVLFTKK